jgi:WD40 repeat protein
LATSDRYALVIGIDGYGSGIPVLGSARKDAEAVAVSLAKEHGYAVTSLLDGEATREAVTDFLSKEIPSRLSAETPFLVYFAGHGVAEGEDGSNGPQGYLILQDAELGKPETWLSMDVLRAALDALACRHLLVVLDCCYAGAFRWATASRSIGLVAQPKLYKSVYDRYLEGEAWQALTSASAAQQAADAAVGLPNLRGVNDEGHSPFAAALIEGLGGAADYSTSEFPADGVITATELYQYVSTCLLPSPEAPTVQTPGIWPLKQGNEGEFVFMNPKVPLKVAPDPPLDDSNNPWLGLEAYTAEKKDLFLGRDGATGELVARVTATDGSGRLVAVVGPSGAGKSSLVGAGLLPALDPSTWAVVQSARLSGDPNAALEAAVKELDAAPKPRRRLLVFDQFEELYTQCPDEGARARFLASVRELVDGHGGPTVVVTLRSDFEARAADDASLREIWAAARYQVPQFSGDELRQVILGPAQVKAVYYDPAKVADDLFDEVSQTPGALPLLSFALAELYRQAQLRRRTSGSADRGLTTADYDAIGGVVGALNRRATQLYDDAAPDEQQAIRRVFLRLVSQEGAGLTRRRVERAELQFGDGEDAEQQCVDRVIQRYVDAGLLVVDGDSVEPAHDALVAQWQQLHEWLKESDSQDLIRAAWRAAEDWEANARAAGYLWNADPRLPLLAVAHRAGELNATERAFETASTRRRTAKRRRLAVTIAAVMAVLIAATAVALAQRSQAIHQRNAATSLVLASAATPLIETHLDESLLFALAANQTEPTAQARSTMTLALETARISGIDAILPNPACDQVNGDEFSPAGNMLAVACSSGSTVLWELAAGKRSSQPLTLAGNHCGHVDAVAFSPDSKTLAAGCGSGNTLLWELAGGQPSSQPLTLPRGDGCDQVTAEPPSSTLISAVAFSPDGKILALGCFNGNVALWELAAGKPEGKPLILPDEFRCIGVSGMAFSTDAKSLTLAVGCLNGNTMLWELVTGKPIGKPLIVPGGDSCNQVFGVTSSEDGKMLAAGCRTGNTLLWGLAGGKPKGKPLTLPGGSGCDQVNGLELSPDSRTLAVGCAGGNTVLWGLAGGKPIGKPITFPAGHPCDEVNPLEFSPDSKTVAAGCFDGNTVLWKLAAGKPSGQPLAVPRDKRCGGVDDLAFGPDGTSLAVGCANRNTLLWQLAAGRPSGRPLTLAADRCGVGVGDVAFDSGAKMLAVGCASGNTLLWKLAAGKPSGKPLTLPGRGRCNQVSGVTFSQDTKILVTGCLNGNVVLWELPGGNPSGSPLTLHGGKRCGQVDGLGLSPDSRTLAVGCVSGNTLLWELAGEKPSGAPVTLPGGNRCNQVNGLGFAPDSQTLAAGCFSGNTVLWKLAGGKPTGQPLTLPRVNRCGALGFRLAFSPDGRTLAVGCAARNTLLWELAGGKPSDQPVILPNRCDQVSGVAFSPDGKTLAVSCLNGNTALWDGILWTTTADLRNQVCSLVRLNLTTTQWNSIAPGLQYHAGCPD